MFAPSIAPLSLALFILTMLTLGMPQSRHSTTGAACLSVVHADAETCTTTAGADTTGFLAAALAADAPVRVLSRAKTLGGSVLRSRTIVQGLLRPLALLPLLQCRRTQSTHRRLQHRIGRQECQKLERNERLVVERSVWARK